jgi:integrase
MATLEKRGNGFRIIFYYRNERFTRSINTDKKTKAEEFRRRLEGNLELLEQGRLRYVPGQDDLPTLLLTDGQLNVRPDAIKLVTLSEFFAQYQAARPPGKEKNTEATEDIHIAHVLRLMGGGTFIADVRTKLQSYITVRAAEKSRSGDLISQVTIKKELSTLTSLWNRWGMRNRLVSVPLTLRNLDYPKGNEKPPFQTWEQIERRIKNGNLTSEQQDEIWDCLFLTVTETNDFLAFAKGNGCLVRNSRKHFAWVYPMLAFAAHTGARRSEILRSRVEDIDFENGEVAIREKKKDRSKEKTLRIVPMSALLRKAMKEWCDIHPGGPITFCRKPGEQFTEAMATHYLDWSLKETKWNVIKGYHCLRHSFISNLASKGIPERMIMNLAGHLNRETTQRYAHLFPSTVHDAIHSVYG